MEDCRLCPQECSVNRPRGEKGVCQATAALEIAPCHPHFGEEGPLVGSRGSGTKKQLALEYFEKALEFNPHHVYLQGQRDRLRREMEKAGKQPAGGVAARV